ncbi:unnamed protein product [Gadus morhua 'NCC']
MDDVVRRCVPMVTLSFSNPLRDLQQIRVFILCLERFDSTWVEVHRENRVHSAVEFISPHLITVIPLCFWIQGQIPVAHTYA